MRTKLVAVVIAGLINAPPLHAQGANVALYGRFNVDMELVNGKQAGSGCPEKCPNPDVFRVSSNSSEFGIRGAEPITGGLSAIFQIENSVSVTQGRGTLAGRDSFVGLTGPWGTFKMGYFLGPYDDILPIFGNVPTLTTSILSASALWAQGFLGTPEAGGFDDRLQQSIRYDTPTMSGLAASFQFASYKGLLRPHSSAISTGAFYTNGPVQLGVAYEFHDRIRGTPAEPLSDHAFSVAGGYQFSAMRIGAVYEKLIYDATPTSSLKRNFFGVSTTVDIGPGLFYAYVGRAGKGTGTAADGTRIGGLTKGVHSGSTQWEASYTYVLSGRTLAYAGYVKIRNESNAAYTFSHNPYPILCNPYPSGNCGRPGGMLVGMAHFF